MSEMESILQQQRECREYLAANPGHRLAVLGLADLVGEEVAMLREERKALEKIA